MKMWTVFPGHRHDADLLPLHGGAVPQRPDREPGRGDLLGERRQQGAGVRGGALRGGVRHLGVAVRRVELDGRLRHYHPLLLQRLAQSSVRLEELPAQTGSGEEDQLPPESHGSTAAAAQRRLLHLLPG